MLPWPYKQIVVQGATDYAYADSLREKAVPQSASAGSDAAETSP